MSRKSISIKEQKLVWGFAAARCSHPSCRILCVAAASGNDPNVTLGEIAHIHSYSDDGPRASKNMPVDERNKYENLILLCANHHTEVDGQPETYNEDVLKGWKSQHEMWIEEQLQSSIGNVSFTELEMVTSSIVSVPVPPTENFQLISPQAKIKKNELSEKIAQRIRMGMVKSREVEKFIRDASKLNGDFPEKVSQGFIKKYEELASNGLKGDSLFEAMHEFSSGGYSDFDRQSAGLAVLVYLFEKCEVFEK